MREPLSTEETAEKYGIGRRRLEELRTKLRKVDSSKPPRQRSDKHRPAR